MTPSQAKVAVAILRSGLAGSASALLLTRSGISTCLIEKSGAEVWKAGEALPPSANPYLHKTGPLGCIDSKTMHSRAAAPDHALYSRGIAANPMRRILGMGAFH